MKITVIGAGHMGGAMLRGWSKFAPHLSLTACARTEATLQALKRDCPHIATSTDNLGATRDADVVVLAVKPWLVEEVLTQIAPAPNGQTIVSVAAGVRHPSIALYAMPNIAAAQGASMTFVENSATPQVLKLGQELFDPLGQTFVATPAQMQAGMMMAGCGIAYVLRFLRAMMQGGTELGFAAGQAQAIAMQTMQGAVALLSHSGAHPELLVDSVCTPGGFTIKGLNELDHAGFSSAVIRALKAGLKS